VTVRQVDVRAGAGDYPVMVGRGLLRRTAEVVAGRVPGVRRWAVVSDSRVAPLHGRIVHSALEAADLALDLLTFPAGERNKTRTQWADLTDRLIAAGLGRDGGVVAVGGGVTGDLAGFVAATFMRGIPVVQVPTSVVAMVDSAVGGKTGVDTPAGKNLVGAFHPPRLVLVDPDTVGTLPRPERAQGWAEAVKHGAIVDAAYLDGLAERAPALLDGDPETVLEAVLRSIEIKAGVVGDDEREAGRREILNFGHTVGHALEAQSGYRLPHGSAVSLGMVLEARLGEALGVTDAGTSDHLARALERFQLPTRLDGPGGAALPDALLLRDKKVRDGVLRIVFLARPGEVAPAPGAPAAWAHPVDRESVRSVLGPEP
jgi:3-dehydroquinate synthase